MSRRYSYDYGGLDYDYEPPDDPYLDDDFYYDEPVERVTDLGGGYQLIERDGLCIIDPDPMEERMDRYYEDLEARELEMSEAEYLASIEDDHWRDSEGNVVLRAGDREW